MPSQTVTREKQALADAFDNVLKAQADEREAELDAARARRRAARRPRLILMASLVALLTLTGWMWHERPDWIFRPTSIPETSAIKEASLRIMMANAAQHVERYRSQRGQLPRSLTVAGAHSAGLSYVIESSDSYRIAGTNGPVTLTLRSEQSLAQFIGNSFTVVSARRKS